MLCVCPVSYCQSKSDRLTPMNLYVHLHRVGFIPLIFRRRTCQSDRCITVFWITATASRSQLATAANTTAVEQTRIDKSGSNSLYILHVSCSVKCMQDLHESGKVRGMKTCQLTWQWKAVM